MRFLVVLSCVFMTAVLSACSGVDPNVDPDAAFIEEIRQRAATAPPSEVGMLPGGEGSPIPEIAIETDHVMMGDVPNYESTMVPLTIYNRGDAPLIISKVTTSCFCTIGRMRETEIPAGGEGILDITFDPFRVQGFEATRKLTLHTNDPRKPRVEIPVTSHVEREFDMEPMAFDFGQIVSGDAAERSMVIRQLQEEPFDITGGSLNVEGLTGEVVVEILPESDWKEPNRKEFRITVKLPEGTHGGQYTGLVEVASSLPRFETIKLPMIVDVLGPYVRAPDEVTLRDVEIGKKYESALMFTSTGGMTFRSIENENELIDVTYRFDPIIGELFFDATLTGAGDSRLQKDTWNIVLEVNGREYQESVKVLMLQPR